MNIAVFVSGRGSNLRSLFKARRDGLLPHGRICAVVSNNPSAPALELARAENITAIAVDHRAFPRDREGHEREILARLAPHEIDFVVLAGYMRLLSPVLLEAFRGRMINIHPSLLPAFPGVHAQRQALEYGVRMSGCTVHFVNEEMDGGPIIVQRPVPVLPGDTEVTLSARILEQEHLALPLAVDLATRGRLCLRGRRVVILAGDGSFPELEKQLPTHEPVIAATGNAHKVEEMGDILADTPVHLLGGKEFAPPVEPEENAPDYRGNAEIKARAWLAHTGMWCLADDSGLEVDALEGRPGVRSSRYAPTSAERNRKLLGELEGVGEEKRTARFVCTVVLAGPAGQILHATGTCEGRIAFEARGEQGFGYDPVFIPEGYGGRHLAELTAAEKNAISHRGRALEALKPRLRHLFSPDGTG